MTFRAEAGGPATDPWLADPLDSRLRKIILARKEGGNMPDVGGARDHKLAASLEQLRAPLMRFFRRRVDSFAEAEDLTQETFARMVGAAGRGSIDNKQSFVFQIAVNLLRDRGRMASVRNEAQIAAVDPHRISELTHEFVEDLTPERVLLGRDDIEEAIRVLGELGERTRDIYILFRLENMTHPQIASLYGISRSTVEKEVMKATLHLGSRMRGKRQ